LSGFPTFPSHSFGEDEGEALARAVDAIESAIISLMGDREDIPHPSRPSRGQPVVTLPALAAASGAVRGNARTRRQ